MPGWTCTTGSRSSQGSHGGGGVHGRGSCVPRYACRVGEIQAQAGAKVYACRSLKVSGRVPIEFSQQAIVFNRIKIHKLVRWPNRWPHWRVAVNESFGTSLDDQTLDL
jgi:hypothetical protein